MCSHNNVKHHLALSFPSVRLPVCQHISVRLPLADFMKFSTEDLYENASRSSRFGQNPSHTKMSVILHEVLNTFNCCLLQVFT